MLWTVSFAARGEAWASRGRWRGRSDLLMASSARTRAPRRVFVYCERVEITTVRAIRPDGFVTEDRKRFGLVLEQTITHNMPSRLAACRCISPNVQSEAPRGARDEGLARQANSVYTIVGTLSGGNQQKVVLAKWLLTNPKVLFLDEPTRGIDVGAKQEIYGHINQLAGAGLAIVLVSSELPEVLGLSDRVMVLHEGRVTGEFKRTEATPEAVMACARATRERRLAGS